MRKILFITAILLCPKFWAQEATFEPLGYITDSPDAFSEANGISEDGSIVTGTSYSINDGIPVSQAFRWENGEMTGIGMLPTSPGNPSWSYARAISADGSAIVGYSASDQAFMAGWEAMLWTEDGGMEALGDFLPSDYWSESTDVSGNGSVVVGRSYMTGQGFRWENGVMESLSTDEIQFVEAWGISADGTTIAGSAIINGVQQAALWKEGEGITGLGAPDGGSSCAFKVSDDGNFAAGFLQGSSGERAFRWSETDGMMELGTLGGVHSHAQDVSNDGTVVVGWSQIESSEYVAFYWTEEAGMQSLKNVLENTYGLDLSGWTLTVANAISGDGKTIVGYGLNPDGKQEAWRVVLSGNMSSDEISQNEIILYPNPTTGIINIQTKETIRAVSVYNSIGQKVTFNSLNKENTSIDISNLPSGTYFIEVTLNNNKTVKRYKVLRK